MLNQELQIKPVKRDEGVDHAALYVSLYIVILAFFILLNTMSTYEQQKAQQVVDSVKNTFAYEKPDVPLAESPTSDMSGSAVTSFLDAIEDQAFEYIPVQLLNVTRDGNMIELSFPISEIFLPDDAVIMPTSQDMLAGFVSSYHVAKDRLAVRVDVVMDMQPAPSLFGYALGDADAMAVSRVGVMARFFNDGGIDAYDLAAGLKQSEKGNIYLRFSVAPIPEDKDSQANEDSGASL